MKKIKKKERIKENIITREPRYPIKIFKENVLFFVLIFVAVLILYGNTFNGQFLSADDLPGIVNNPMVKDFAGSMKTYEIEKMFPALIFKLFGMNAVAFHAFSISMHFINIVLVFIFVMILFGRTEAIITTLIFMVHPLNSETVSWISAYGYLIYTFFTLLILITYVIWFKTKDSKYLTLSISIFVTCMIFYRKPWIALIPVYIVLIDQLILGKNVNLKKITTYFWFIVPTLIYMLVWVRESLATRQQLLATVYYNDPATATPYFIRVLYTIYMTAKLILFPSSLTIYHEGEKVRSITEFTMLSGTATVLVVMLVIYLFKKPTPFKKYIGALILLIYSTMALSFYPTVVVWSMAERYLYLATLFFGLIVALLYKRYGGKVAAKYILIAVLVIYSIKTVWRTNDWKSSKNLWIATQKVSPYSYRVYNNLGDIYAGEKDYPKAIENFQIALQISPKFADAVHNLGYTYYQMGNLEQAKTYLEKSYEINPLMYQALHKLGVIAYQQKDLNLARQYFVKTLEVEPSFEPAIKAIKFIDSLPAK